MTIWDDAVQFTHQKPKGCQQNQLIKRDTIVSYNNVGCTLLCHRQPLLPIRFVKASYNDEGVEVDNVYYDNIVNLNVYHGAMKTLLGGDFRKQQFKHIVPSKLSESELSSAIDLHDSIDKNGVHYIAVLVIPDSMSSYEVLLTVSYTGHLQMRLR